MSSLVGNFGNVITFLDIYNKLSNNYTFVSMVNNVKSYCDEEHDYSDTPFKEGTLHCPDYAIPFANLIQMTLDPYAQSILSDKKFSKVFTDTALSKEQKIKMFSGMVVAKIADDIESSHIPFKIDKNIAVGSVVTNICDMVSPELIKDGKDMYLQIVYSMASLIAIIFKKYYHLLTSPQPISLPIIRLLLEKVIGLVNDSFEYESPINQDDNDGDNDGDDSGDDLDDTDGEEEGDDSDRDDSDDTNKEGNNDGEKRGEKRDRDDNNEDDGDNSPDAKKPKN